MNKPFLKLQFLITIVAITKVDIGNCEAPVPASPPTPASSPAGQPPTTPPTENKFHRLPTNVKPTAYELSLKPDLKTSKFEGRLVVSIQITDPTDTIVLNCVDLEIKEVQLSTQESLRPSITPSPENEVLILKFSKPLETGGATLTIKYTGNLADNGIGFYKAAYSTPPTNNEKYFLVTQFKPKDARRCFPCWDEPAIKAQFSIALIVDRDKMAISNMPVDTETDQQNGLKEVKFVTSPMMSTYLVAFAVGYFDFIEGKSPEGIFVKIFTPLGKKDQGKFALDLTTTSLSFFSNYLGVPFPLSKLDSVAVTDFYQAGTENFGLILYSESSVLDDPVNSSQGSRKDVALTICQNISLQWVGDLVTLKWWSDLWLHQGFATFMQYLGVDYAIPDYNIWPLFISDVLRYSMVPDAYQNTHPIEATIEDPSQIDLLFDDISYTKGAFLFRMLRYYLGEENFKKALNLYITKYRFGNANTEDFWTVMEEATATPIKKIMSSWTKQAGFPMLIVEKSTQEANNVRTLTISQKKFFANPSIKDDKMLWTVPLLFSKQSNADVISYKTLLEGQRMTVSIPDVTENEWVKLNFEMVVYFRTKYPDELFQKFIPSIQEGKIPLIDRMTILDDVFAFAQCGQASTVDFLKLVKIMSEEEDLAIWTNINTYFEQIINLLLGLDFLPSLYTYGSDIMQSIRKKVGYDVRPDDKRVTPITRWFVLNLLFLFEDSDFAQVSLKRFNDHVSGVSILASSLRAITYRTALAINGKQAFDGMLKIYRATDSEEERHRVANAFVGVKDVNLVDEMLKFCISDEIRQVDTWYGIQAIAESKVGRDKTWDFVKTNFDTIRRILSDDLGFWRVIKSTIENFTNENKINEVEAFFKEKNINISTVGPIQEAFESIRINAAWLKRDSETIKQYLTTFKT